MKGSGEYSSRMRNPVYLIFTFAVIGSVLLYLVISYRNENTVLKDKVSYYVYKTTTQMQALTKSQNSLETCAAEEESLQQGIRSVQQQLKNKEEELRNTKDSYDECTGKRKLGEKFYTELKQILGKEEELNQLERAKGKIPGEAYDNLKSAVQALKDSNGKLEELTKEKEELKEKLQSQLEEMGNVRTDYDSKLNLLKTQMEGLMNEKNNLEKKINGKEDSLRAFQIKDDERQAPNVKKIDLNKQTAIGSNTVALTNLTNEKPAPTTEATRQAEEKKEIEEKIGNEVLENGNSEDDHKDQPAATAATTLGATTLKATEIKANIQNANDHNVHHDPDYHHDTDDGDDDTHGDGDPTH